MGHFKTRPELKFIFSVYFADYGIKNVGHLALRCLRIEKFIPFWGEELTGDTSPTEVNRAYKVKFDKKHLPCRNTDS